jgi:two-component system, OmpR family, alkaline phosphatase synthesis response regulator PhoP
MGAKAAKTIIYVEDEPAVQRLVVFWLEDAGFRVLVAGDGAAGMELIRSTVPDLIVTDALMPVLTGDELVEQLQQDADLRDIPIIMATAAASPLRVRKMMSLGCKSVVAKPMDEESFLDAVYAALE